MTGNPATVAAHLLAEFSVRAEDLLDAARRVRTLERNEAIHDLRVATRRLSDILSLWRGALDKPSARKARRDLSRLRRALGPVREYEVHLRLLTTLIEQEPPTLAIAGRVLQSRLEARLEHDRRDAARAASTGKIARILVRVERASAGLSNRLADAPGTIDDAMERAGRREARARAALEQLSPGGGAGDTLHQARIAAKKARYTLECMTAIGVSEDGESVREFRRVQRQLGNAHDWATLLEWIDRERARRLRHAADPAGAFPLVREDESIAELALRALDRERKARAAFRAPRAPA